MKPIKIIIAALALIAVAVLGSCAMDDGKPNDHATSEGIVSISVYLRGTVENSSGEPLKGIQVAVSGTANTTITDSNGAFFLESTKKVVPGNPNEKISIIARDMDMQLNGGFYDESTVEITIGEWADNRAVLTNIQIVMNLSAALK